MTCCKRRRNFYDWNACDHSAKQNSEMDIQTKMIILKAAPSVVSLRSLIGEKALFLCSGIIVESKADEDGGFINYILTAASLLASPSGELLVQSDLKVFVHMQDGKSYEGEVDPYAVDFHYNVALIKMKSDSPLPELVVRYLNDSLPMKDKASAESTPFRLRPHHQSGKEEKDSKYVNIHPGDQVIALGRSFLHSVLMVEIGLFSLETCKWDCQELFMTTCKPYEDLIGGPLINGDGDVVGIIFFERGYSPFLPSNIACKCLECFKKHEIVHRPLHGILASNLYAADVAVLEKLTMKCSDIQSGVIAEKIKRGSPAALAGIQPKDVISCCNGNPISCLMTFLEIMWDNAGKCVDMEVRRADGACLKVVVSVEETPPERFNEWPFADSEDPEEDFEDDSEED